jgi:hypothetical protein
MSNKTVSEPQDSQPRAVNLSRAAFLLVAFLAIITLAVNARAWLAATLPPKSLAYTAVTTTSGKQPAVLLNTAAAVTQGASPRDRVTVERITIRPTGFDPAETTLSKGRSLLTVDNRSGLREVVLRLDKEAGNRLQEVRVQREKLDWRRTVDFEPGRYLLTEAAHPGWTCRITVTAQ